MTIRNCLAAKKMIDGGSLPELFEDTLDFGVFLESGRYADVEFVVRSGPYSVSRTFKAHKQLLAMRSDVFGAMFRGSLRERDTVLIRDLHPNGFRGLLTYVYTGRSAINNIEDAIYTRDAAMKYRFLDLASTCTEYIQSHLEADDVCTVIDHSFVSYGEVRDDVVDEVILGNAESVLSSAAFTISMEHTVNFVLDRVDGVPTKVVIKAVLRWAGAQCGPRVANWEHTGTVAAAVRKFLPKIKFLALSVRQMTKFIRADTTCDILSSDEASAILCKILEPGSVSPLPEWLNPERDISTGPNRLPGNGGGLRGGGLRGGGVPSPYAEGGSPLDVAESALIRFSCAAGMVRPDS
ncbi:BTB/POZ domain-containing protein 6-like [Dermacentor andersoni]|uniref:BTB/POZ domain-containing protein 6-like n=1 Tax=Dermacentor andersoni TaxID=34620 RepID=UPI0024177C53|nr:speckle-type POZ protein-like [Dermacentor andersoni]